MTTPRTIAAPSLRHLRQVLPPDLVAHLDGWVARRFVEDPGETCVFFDGVGTELVQSIFDALTLSAVVPALSEMLGPIICFPLKSCLFRQMTIERGTPFHQDASFMGDGYLSIACSIPIQDCSAALPGLEFLHPSPGRYIPPRDIPGSGHASKRPAPWRAEEYISLYGEPPSTMPELHAPVCAAGDALLFDHYTVHRTQPTQAGAHATLELRAVGLCDAIERFANAALVVVMPHGQGVTHRRITLFHTGAPPKTDRPWAERLGGMVPEAMHPHEHWREIMALRDQVVALQVRAAKAERTLADAEVPLWRRWWRRLYAAMQPR